MCTLIVARNVFEGFSIAVAANRDEMLDRLSEPPHIRDGTIKILAPKDLQRGGTWIGVNEFGVLAALTNRIDVKSRWGCLSRGQIVMEALEHSSAYEAYADTKRLDNEKLNGFHLVIADKTGMFLVKCDGRTIERREEDNGVLVVTNHGVGRFTTSSPPRRVTHILRVWQEKDITAQKPTPKTLAPLLAIHDDWRHGTCINQPEENYGTKSSSIIRLKTGRLGDIWQYWHRERTSPERHVCLEKFGPCIELAVQNP